MAEDKIALWIVSIVALVAIIGLIFTSTGTQQLAEDEALAGKAREIVAKKTDGKVAEGKFRRDTIPKTGCYLDLATKRKGGQIYGGTEVGIFSYSQEDCYSLYLVFQFGHESDALRIVSQELKETGYHNSRSLVQNELKSRPTNRVYVVKWKDHQQTSLKGGPLVTIFQQPSDDDQCTTLNFFGIPLYCFNGVVVDGVGRLKQNHFEEIIAPLAFLKVTARDDIYNSLTNSYNDPFDFLIQEKIEFIDGTKIIALNAHFFSSEELNDLLATAGNIALMPIKDVDCLEEGHGGAANFQFRSSDLTIKYPRPQSLTVNSNMRYVTFFCKEGLLEFGGKAGDAPSLITQTQAEEPRMAYAGIDYHEGSHKFKSHENAPCSGYDDDWESVYGAHVLYLFQASEDERLTCYERQFLYAKAQEEFNTKLCLNAHNYNQPSCILPADKQAKAEDLAREYAQIYIDD